VSVSHRDNPKLNNPPARHTCAHCEHAVSDWAWDRGVSICARCETAGKPLVTHAPEPKASEEGIVSRAGTDAQKKDDIARLIGEGLCSSEIESQLKTSFRVVHLVAEERGLTVVKKKPGRSRALRMKAPNTPKPPIPQPAGAVAEGAPQPEEATAPPAASIPALAEGWCMEHAMKVIEYEVCPHDSNRCCTPGCMDWRAEFSIKPEDFPDFTAAIDEQFVEELEPVCQEPQWIPSSGLTEARWIPGVLTILRADDPVVATIKRAIRELPAEAETARDGLMDALVEFGRLQGRVGGLEHAFVGE
jgi:hypothetical protein